MRELPLRFAECTWEEVDGLPRDACVLILPVGSTEPHGPHLPLATDVVISEGMALRAARDLRARGVPCLVLPSILYSVTDFAEGFAGGISLRFETARDVMADVLAGLARQGFERFCIANSHLEPRHVDSITTAIEASGVRVAFPDKRRRRWASTLTDEFRSGACHAGSYETSLVLADRPDLVLDDVRAGLPPVEASLSVAIRDGKQTFREAGGERAYFGFPADASGEEGEATYAALARMLVESIEETYGLLDER
jgi:creatinine amidohydrolase